MAHLPLTLEWFDSKKGPSKKADKSIPISEIYEIKRGHQTPTFWSFAASRGVSGMHLKELCFSIDGDDRTVDVGCETKELLDGFLQAIGGLTRWVKEAKMRAANKGAPTMVGMGGGGQHVTHDEAYDEEGAHVANVPYDEAEDKGKLFAAVKTDNLEVVRFHLDQKNCPIDIMEDHSGDTVLISACRLGR